MKEFAKKIFYFVFRLFSIVKTSFFSRFLISSGYLLKSEGLYNHSKVRAFKDRREMHGYLASQYISPDEKIHFMEFGVFWGQTFRIWVEGNTNPQTKFAGFDTFTGLPEDWGSEKKGTFSAAGKLPDIHDPRIEWQVGLIQDTLPLYIKKISKDERKVIHIDVDLYNASLITLICLSPISGLATSSSSMTSSLLPKPRMSSRLFVIFSICSRWNTSRSLNAGMGIW